MNFVAHVFIYLFFYIAYESVKLDLLFCISKLFIYICTRVAVLSVGRKHQVLRGPKRRR